MGIRDRPVSPRSPWQNPYAERLIGTLRRDCLDHVLIFGERHLGRVLTLYSRYYNETRTHLGLGKDAPLRRASDDPGQDQSARRQGCGRSRRDRRRGGRRRFSTRCGRSASITSTYRRRRTAFGRRSTRSGRRKLLRSDASFAFQLPTIFAPTTAPNPISVRQAWSRHSTRSMRAVGEDPVPRCARADRASVPSERPSSSVRPESE